MGKAQDEEKLNLQAEQEPQEANEEAPAEEPQHPGWLTLSEVYGFSDPFFNNFLYLLGYDYSSNVYVIKGDYLTVIDPGNDYTGLMDLFRRGHRPEDIKKIVLTHGHRDHSMGAVELLRAYPHFAEGGGFELILHPESPAELKEVMKKFGCQVTEVKGGEILELSGLPWEVIYTPGHTIDGLSYYHAPSKTVITGDTSLPHAMAKPDENAGGRLDHYLYGIKALLKKDIVNLLPGHGIPVAELGKFVVEQTYESLLLKIIGIETQIPWIEGAEKLVEKGLLEEAIFCVDKDLARDPENLRALQFKAFCLTDMGRCEESLPYLDRILEQQADNFHALLAKGHALLGMGKYDDCLPYFDRVLKQHPNVREAYIFKGMALFLSGRVDEAMDIPAFSMEFSGRFKEQLEKRSQTTK